MGGNMPEKKVWNERIGTLSRDEVERIRIRKLRQQLKYGVRAKVEFVHLEALGRVAKKTPIFEEEYR